MSNKTKISSHSINPFIWGPLFWNLLHEIAKHTLEIKNNNGLLDEYNKLLSTIPYILPCVTCREHTEKAYERTYSKYGKLVLGKPLTSLSKVPEWVWKMKSIANENSEINSSRLSYDMYLTKLKYTTSFISETALWDLLFMIVSNYPNKGDSDESRQGYYIKFIKSLCIITENIPELKKFKFLANITNLNSKGVFNGINEFQNYLLKAYETEYGKKFEIKKYHK